MGMNGMQPNPAPVSEDTPIAYYQPIAITPGTIKWIVAGIIGAIWSLNASGYLFVPAKDSEFKALQTIVETVRTQQDQFRQQMETTRDALSRLTLAVDNMAGLVAELKQRPRTVIQKATR